MAQQGAHALRPFRVVAVNVNGLADASKRRTFFAWVHDQKCDVVLLSETHCKSPDQGQQWVQEGTGRRAWRGQAFFACANGHQQRQRPTSGVAVLLSQRIVAAEAEAEIEYADNEGGRLLRVRWQAPWGQHLAAMAVYAPAVAACRPSFYATEYMRALDAGMGGARLIVGGDFNCALTAADVMAAPGTNPLASSRMVGGQDLQLVNSTADLVDVWRKLYPHRQQPTHYSFSGGRSAAASSQQPQHGQQQPAPTAHAVSGGRLDYIFLPADMLADGWVQSCRQLERWPSDHRPVVVSLQPPTMPLPGQRRWQLPAHLLGNAAFVEAVGQGLREVRTGQMQQQQPPDPATAWEQLVQCAVHLCKAEAYRHRLLQRVQVRQRCAAVAAMRHQQQRELQELGQVQPATTAALLQAEHHLSSFQQQRLEQQAAALEPLWELYGEKPTRFFHSLGRAPTEIEHIAEVTVAGGVVTLDSAAGVAAAADALADFYDPAAGGLFACHPTDAQQQQVMLGALDKQLSNAEQQACQGPNPDGSITVAEAAAALSSLPRGKAPGSDGLTYEFYQAFWGELGETMVAAFNHVLRQRQQACDGGGQPQWQQQQQAMLSARQRLGLITLIYKGGGKPRADPDSYRPITLLNCDVKIVAKVLVQRLGPVLGSVVDSTQTAFVPGRDIADNVMLHLEEIEHLHATRQPGCIVFLDFAKAYDRLDRGWLQQCMQRMSFPASTTAWVQLLLAGTQGCITFNGGHTSRVFEIPSGCAQGSPLSPLLYVLAAQPLAARCRQLQATGAIDSIRLPDGSPAPCCHQHADDTALHAADRRSAAVLLQQAVQPFCAASGALLNRGKCQGLAVGGAQHRFVGVDTATGVTFPDTATQPIKHLGVLLSAEGAMEHAGQLYRQRLRAITWRVRQWSQCNLTLLGRCEVARQVLAACVTYHAQFVPVPADLMSSIHTRITAFVLGKPCLPQHQLQQLRGSPPAVVAALPYRMGGIRQVDVRARARAMQAKVAAAALHPRRAAWKPFFAATLRRALPDLGEAALVQQAQGPISTAMRQGRLGQRHAAYVHAIQGVGIHRHMPHATMSAEQVCLELVVGNHSVGDGTSGTMLAGVGSIPAGLVRSAGLTLGQAAQQLAQQPGLLAVPTAWRGVLQHQPQPAPVPLWRSDPQQRWVCRSNGEGQTVYQVQADGSLRPAGLHAAAPTGEWVPCCVVDAAAVLHPVAEQQRRAREAHHQPGQQQLPGQQPPPEGPTPRLFLVGPWATIRVDPSVWGLGWDRGLLQFSVAAATLRLQQGQCSNRAGWVPGVGQRPRLWRGGDGSELVPGGLQQLEAGQKRCYADMLQGRSSRGGAGGDFSTEAQMAAYHASWMDRSPARLLPQQRAANAAAVVTEQRQHQAEQEGLPMPAVNDLADPLTGVEGDVAVAGHAWVAAYARLCNKQLPRQLRVFGWELLHGAVQVGARRMHAVRQDLAALAACACCHLPCTQQPQRLLATLSHTFVECPVAVAAWRWVASMWQQVQPGSQVPITDVRVILLDDDRVWAPHSSRAGLWTMLRLIMLESLHMVGAAQQQRQRSQMGSSGGGADHPSQQQAGVGEGSGSGAQVAAAVVNRCKAELQRLMRADWQRVCRDIREDAGVPMSWLRGPSPIIAREVFDRRWQGLVSHAYNPPVLVEVPAETPAA